MKKQFHVLKNLPVFQICETELGLCSPEETDDSKYAEDTDDTDDTDNKIFAYPESR